MDAWICVTCGVQFAAGEKLPRMCSICEDKRQYVGYNGQQWTTLAKMRADGFRNVIRDVARKRLGFSQERNCHVPQHTIPCQRLS